MDEIVETEEPAAVEMAGLELWRHRIAIWFRRVGRRIPRLVWHGDEIDAVVTFSQDTLDPDDPMRGLFSGGLFEIEKQLRHMGITFDTGQGCDGRDWEWDWSLSGPISLRFQGRAKNPERRAAPKPPPELKLVS